MNKLVILTLLIFINFSNLMSQRIDVPVIFITDTAEDNSETVLSGTDIDSITNSSGTQDNETADTLKVISKIESVWEANNRFFVKVRLIEKDTPIELKMFNMLGKLVANIYKGTANDEEVFDFEANLQNGIYICVLTGPKIRDAEKFILSR